MATKWLIAIVQHTNHLGEGFEVGDMVACRGDDQGVMVVKTIGPKNRAVRLSTKAKARWSLILDANSGRFFDEGCIRALERIVRECLG